MASTPLLAAFWRGVATGAGAGWLALVCVVGGEGGEGLDGAAGKGAAVGAGFVFPVSSCTRRGGSGCVISASGVGI